MVPAKETAEEQLLRMIEGPAGPRPARAPLRGFSPKRLFEELRDRGEKLWRLALASPQARETPDVLLWRLHVAERAFWVALAGLVLFLMADLLFVKRQPPVLMVQTLPASGGPAQPSASAPAEDRLKPLAEYQGAIVARDPFGTALAKQSGAGEQESQGRLAGLTATLSVVGINRGRVPEALIEDSATGRTYVVKIGDQVNGLTVRGIDQRGVTVVYENEETLLE